MLAQHARETTNELAEHVASSLENVKILFIFDGWDEFPAECKAQNIHLFVVSLTP